MNLVTSGVGMYTNVLTAFWFIKLNEQSRVSYFYFFSHNDDDSEGLVTTYFNCFVKKIHHLPTQTRKSYALKLQVFVKTF